MLQRRFDTYEATSQATEAVSRSWPLLPDVGVLALVPDRWGDLWQSRHHVLSRLSRYFHVIWVSPSHAWRHTLRAVKTKAHCGAVTPVPPGLTVYEPELWLPKFYGPPWLRDLTFRIRLNRACDLLRRQGCQRLILYVWRPQFAPALSVVSHDLSCYHIVDDYAFAEVNWPLADAERQVIADVDQVFIHSPALLEKKGHLNTHTMFVPNGVDYQAYARPVAEPADLSSIPHPRIGYTGWLKKQLDWPLLADLAQRHPEWSFVFVGARSPSHREIAGVIEALERRPNVYFLGAKPFHELARYPQHFDVCMMPYRADDYTKYIYPLKLHEYLASGRPAVGTRIRSLEAFAHVVTLPHTRQEWSEAIAAALQPETNGCVHQSSRQAIAQQHDWDLLVAKIARTMATRLDLEMTEMK
ncbi:MAG: hypothetical protein ETSY1_36595 [Candidatus Entotheonella factor]|uniref:Glycosyltransferase family 1 protein n=1 Tax=Entotheonella factor TaxID=1429438 RepID=W4L7L7_ENTF1|nr:MAG: hypothetical protein ETSY1_36595 [Candidatus Entotheonella factor]